jgi:hypothetical protein
MFDKDMVLLDCGNYWYLICSAGEDYSPHQLIYRKLFKKWFQGLALSNFGW